MAYGVYFKAKGNVTEIWMGGIWEGKVETVLSAEDALRLGKKLVRLGKGWRRSFKFTLGSGKNIITVTAKRSYRSKMPLLTFEYEDIHTHFEKNCTNTFFYDGFTLSEITEFGRSLLEYGKSGFAFIGDIK